MSAKKNNIKFYKNTLIVLGLVVILVAAYIWVVPLIQPDNEENKDEEAPNPEAVQLIKVNESSIVRMTIDNKEDILDFTWEPYTVTDENGNDVKRYKWIMNKPTGYDDIDQMLVRGIQTNFANIKSTKIIEKNPEDLSKYGLDNPEKITVETNTGEEITMKVGDKVPLLTATYVLVNDDPTVYTIKSYTAGKCTPTVTELRSKELFSYDNSIVDYISMGRDGKKLFSANRTVDDSWLLDYPIEVKSNAQTIGPMLESLCGLFIQKFVEEKPKDLSKYHLDNPYYEFEIKTIKGHHKKVYLGKEDKTDSTFYARFDDSNEVVKVPSVGLTFIDKPLTEVMQLFTYIVNYKYVDKLVVNIKGEPEQITTIQYNPEDTSKDVFYINGKEATMTDEEGHQVWRLYYKSVIGVLLKDIDTEAQPEGEPEITFTFYQNDDAGKVVVGFIPTGDGETYYCTINGEYNGMIVDDDQFFGKNGVMEAYNHMMEYVNGDKTSE